MPKGLRQFARNKGRSKTGYGRPFLKPEDRARKLIQFRVPKDKYLRWLQAAKRKRLSLSAFLQEHLPK
jgi:hypothetical protein